jgi:hypothetical protein
MFRSRADVALKTFPKNGRPLSAKRKLVEELKKSWEQRTGEKAGYSGRTKFKEPNAVFAQFVKVVTEVCRPLAADKRW